MWKRRILELFVVASGTSFGVVVVLLLTAKTPDADEFTRGIPAALTGAFVGWMARGIMPAVTVVDCVAVVVEEIPVTGATEDE